jgi:hypothetical protein
MGEGVMLVAVLVFVGFSVLPIFFNVTVGRATKRRRALFERGVRSTAEITRVGSVMGAVVISTTAIYLRYEAGPAASRKTQDKMIPVTGGVVKPRVGERVDIVFDPEDPSNADIIGNPGLHRINNGARWLANMLWAAMGVALILEAIERAG